MGKSTISMVETTRKALDHPTASPSISAALRTDTKESQGSKSCFGRPKRDGGYFSTIRVIYIYMIYIYEIYILYIYIYMNLYIYIDLYTYSIYINLYNHVYCVSIDLDMFICVFVASIHVWMRLLVCLLDYVWCIALICSYH